MKILNTANQSIIRLFEDKLATITTRPTAGAEDLFRKLARRRLLPLTRRLGLPSIQLFGLQLFSYGGRNFEIDATWTYPDGAIDGINASFMIESFGRGFQFILFDHHLGTIFESWLGCNNLDGKLITLVNLVEQYCTQRSKGTFTVP